jgi:hypothetical protein
LHGFSPKKGWHAPSPQGAQVYARQLAKQTRPSGGGVKFSMGAEDESARSPGQHRPKYIG